MTSPQPQSTSKKLLAGRISLDADLGVEPIPRKAQDFVGSRMRNELPAILMDATSQGKVFSIANTMAVLAALGRGPGEVIVGDLDLANLAGVQRMMLLAVNSDDQRTWLTAVKKQYPEPSTQLETLLQGFGEQASFARFKERLRNDHVGFYNLNLAEDIGDLHDVDGKGFSAVYISNIETYLGGFLSESFDAQLAGSAQRRFRTNVLSLTGDETLLIHGGGAMKMQVENAAKASQNWMPATAVQRADS